MTSAAAAASPASDVAAGAPLRVVAVARVLLWAVFLGNLARVPSFSAGTRAAPLLATDVAVGVLLVVGALAAGLGRSLLVDGVARAGALFVVIGGASAIAATQRFGLSSRDLLVSLAYLVRWAAYFGVYVVVANSLRRQDLPSLVTTLERMIFAFAVFGIAQSVFLPGFAQRVYPDSVVTVDWDAQGRRLVSTFLDPNFAGALVVFGLLLSAARVAAGAGRRTAPLSVLVVALALTVSRSSVLAAVVGVGVIVVVAGASRRLARFGVGVVACAALAAPWLLGLAREYNKLTLDASALQRLISWAQAARIFVDSPLFGIGFNTYGFVLPAYGVDVGRLASSFSLDGGLIYVAVLTGVVGLVVYVAMLSRVGAHARLVWRHPDASPDERALALATVAATWALVVHSLFVNSLLLPLLMAPLTIMWGAVAVASHELRRLPPSAIRPRGLAPSSKRGAAFRSESPAL